MGHAKDALRVESGETPLDLTNIPHCPRCGTPMEARRAKHGQRVGERFWGCPNFFKQPPDKCSGTINISTDGTWFKSHARAPSVVGVSRADVANKARTAKVRQYQRMKQEQTRDTDEDEWEDNELDEKLEEWMQEEEGPRVIKPEDQLQITYKVKFSTKEESTWMTAMSIKILLGDDDLEVVKIIDRAGKPVLEEELP